MTLLAVAVQALRRNLLRTLLTVLGVAVGVAAVVTIVALGRGARRVVEDRVMSAGTNMVVVLAGNHTAGGVRLGMGSASTLTSADADAIAALPGIALVAPGIRTRQQLVSGRQNWSTIVEGTGADLPAVRSWTMALGYFFTPEDVGMSAKVCVIGSTVRNVLFPNVDPIGRTIRVGRQPFVVRGVLAAKGQSSVGEDQDDVVFAPYTTVQKKLMGVTYLRQVSVSAATSGQVRELAESVRRLLRLRHGIQPDGVDDFRVRTLEDIVAVRTRTTRTMTWLLAGTAAIALLVGGIGVMNIMLVSATERTREIGIRLAVGARTRDVLVQFLAEASFITLAGGSAGVGLGYALSVALTHWLAWPTYLSIDTVVVACTFATAVGVVFGWYPAYKASATDPIDALRFE